MHPGWVGVLVSAHSLTLLPVAESSQFCVHCGTTPCSHPMPDSPPFDVRQAVGIALAVGLVLGMIIGILICGLPI